MEELIRTEMLLGKENVEKLKNKSVIVFGVGGVGGYICEALARGGVGKIDLVDNDIVSLSNINRQIIALHSTVGKYKVDVMRERIYDISPEIEVNTYKVFFSPETSHEIDLSKYDYVADAIDYVKGKLELALICDKLNIPIISSMGAGNKLDPCAFKVADIYNTSVCPLAKAMRTKLKKLGVKKLKTVYSIEAPSASAHGERVPASCSFVPSVAGLIIAGEIIKDLIK